MKSPIRIASLTLGLSLLLCSCPETTVPTNFGVQPLKLDTSDWEGRWHGAGAKDEKDSVVFTITDAEKGIFKVQGTGKDDKPIEVFVHTAGSKEDKLCFLTYTGKPSDLRGPLHLVTKPKDGVFLLWDANHESIEKAIKARELKGKVIPGEKEGEQHSDLDSEPSNYPKLLEPKYWNWSEPQTFVRAQ